MKILVIPDIHLKSYIFDNAEALLREGKADRAVCLMDIPDDWNKQYCVELYAQTYDRAIRFAKDFPDTLWCYGNHDLCYLWNQRESGYSGIAQYTVREKLRELEKVADVRYLQRIDNVLFSHAGVSEAFARTYGGTGSSIDQTIQKINGLGWYEMWREWSPIWLRPQYADVRMYKPRKLLQVVGHTPVTEVTKQKSVVSCDVFSTYSDGTNIGPCRLPIIDSVSWEILAK